MKLIGRTTRANINQRDRGEHTNILCRFLWCYPRGSPLFQALSKLSYSLPDQSLPPSFLCTNAGAVPLPALLPFSNLFLFFILSYPISSPTSSLEHLFLVSSVGERWRQIGERLATESEAD